MFKKYQILASSVYEICVTFFSLEASLKLQNFRCFLLPLQSAGEQASVFHFSWQCGTFPFPRVLSLYYSAPMFLQPYLNTAVTEHREILEQLGCNTPPMAQAQHRSQKDEGETVKSLREQASLAAWAEVCCPRLRWNKAVILDCKYLSATLKFPNQYHVLLRNHQHFCICFSFLFQHHVSFRVKIV